MNKVPIPWGSWYENADFPLTFPGSWKVTRASMTDHGDMSDSEIKKAIENPISSERIRKMAEGKKTAAIAVDDLTRPTQAYRFLPLIMDELNRAGIRNENIKIILALGCHRPLMRPDFEKKIGRELAARFPIYNHNAYENNVDTGTTSRGTPIQVNRFFMESDVKIGIGFITPHPAAVFGGGAKIVIPGIGSIWTIERNHAPAFKGTMLGTCSYRDDDLDKNELRLDMEEGAGLAGLDFIVNSVGTSDGKSAGVFAGDYVKAHRAAVESARKVYFTESPTEADIGIFNAFPEDTELHQAQKALNVWRGNMEKNLVREGGTVIICSASSEGLGFHSLGDRGSRLHRKADKQRPVADMFHNRKVIVFSPNCSRFDLLERYGESVIIRNRWDDVLDDLGNGAPSRSVTVYPNGSLQLLG